jgi:hypothetical protein
MFLSNVNQSKKMKQSIIKFIIVFDAVTNKMSYEEEDGMFFDNKNVDIVFLMTR